MEQILLFEKLLSCFSSHLKTPAPRVQNNVTATCFLIINTEEEFICLSLRLSYPTSAPATLGLMLRRVPLWPILAVPLHGVKNLQSQWDVPTQKPCSPSRAYLLEPAFSPGTFSTTALLQGVAVCWRGLCEVGVGMRKSLDVSSEHAQGPMSCRTEPGLRSKEGRA